MKKQTKTQSMQQIADALDTSRTTVSLCLSGNAQKYNISPETIRRVTDYAESIGFVSNTLAQTVAKGHNDRIGLLFNFTRFEASRTDALFYLINKLEAENRRYQVENLKQGALVESILELKSTGISDIIVVYVYEFTDEEYSRLKPYLNNMRLYFNNLTNKPNIPRMENVFITETNRIKIYHEACDYLVSLGHKRIFCDNNNIKYFNSYKGFEDVLSLGLVRVDMTRFYSGIEAGRELAKRIIAKRADFNGTVFFCHNHMFAEGAMHELLANGIRIPEDMSIICFGDADNLDLFQVPLTSIRVPVYKMANDILESLTKGMPIPETLTRHSELVIRKSCGPVA